MTNSNRSELGRLQPLSELPALDVRGDSDDVRGWEVDASDGSRVGIVRDLLVDPDRLRAEYLMVDLDESLINGPHDKGVVLVPVATARLDRTAELVATPATVEDIQTMPRYARQAWTH